MTFTRSRVAHRIFTDIFTLIPFFVKSVLLLPIDWLGKKTCWRDINKTDKKTGREFGVMYVYQRISSYFEFARVNLNLIENPLPLDREKCCYSSHRNEHKSLPSAHHHNANIGYLRALFLLSLTNKIIFLTIYFAKREDIRFEILWRKKPNASKNKPVFLFLLTHLLRKKIKLSRFFRQK